MMNAECYGFCDFLDFPDFLDFSDYRVSDLVDPGGEG